MIAALPQLARPRRAEAANAAPLVSAAAQSVSTSAATAPSAPTVIPTLPPIPQNGGQNAASASAPAATTQPAKPEQAAPASSSADTLPSPADPAAVPGQAQASIPDTSVQQDLAAFVNSVKNGQANLLTGVYASGVFAMKVEQQPGGDVNFVSTDDQAVTEYSRSDAFGVIGLLAHNTLPAGQEFYKLKTGEEVLLIYGDGRQVRYRISRVENYQALSPNDPYSDFVDLNGPGGNLVRNEDLFRRIYTVSGQLVFQTCFAANGDPSWGRTFIIATPV